MKLTEFLFNLIKCYNLLISGSKYFSDDDQLKKARVNWNNQINKDLKEEKHKPK